MGLKQKIIYKLMKTNEEIEEIYRQKGICDEWIEAKKAHLKKMKTSDKIFIAGALTVVDRYYEAEELLNELNIDKEILDKLNINVSVTDIDQGLYCTTLLRVYIGQNRISEALELFKNNQRFLDDLFSAPLKLKHFGIDYYEIAAVLLAMSGDNEAAERYLELERKAAEKYDKTGIYPKITYVHILNISGKHELSEKEAESARIYIENYDQYDFPWEKNNYLKLLDKALN